MSGVTSNTARRIRGGPDLPASPAFKDAFLKSGSAAGLYVCLSAGSWSGPLDSTSDVGDFTGPASSTDNALVRFDGAGGKTGQNSVVIVGDTGNVTGLGTLNTHTLPAGTDTLVGRASTDTLTNKTLTSPAITTPTGIVKGDVGLGSVDNTSDAAKPVSTAQQTALNLKADDDAVAHDTGDETIAGVKTFSSDPLIPDEAYGVGWNGSLEPPTKNAVYDKIETLGGVSPILASYLATTVTYNNTDALADTALSVTVVTSGIYAIELVLNSDSGAATSLLNDFGGTATITNFIGQWHSYQQDDPGSATSAVRVTSAGTDFSASSLDNAESFRSFRGTIEVNNGGTFIVRGAQRSAQAVNTTILRGSSLILTKLN